MREVLGALCVAGTVFAWLTAASPAVAAAVGAPGVALPVHALTHACTDLRYPALAGAWIVGCGPDGRVDRALSLATGREVRLPRALDAPALGPAVVYAPGPAGGFWVLGADGSVKSVDVARLRDIAVAPAATDGAHVAVLSADKVQAFPTEARSRPTFEVRARGWYAPALAWPWVAWVEDAGGGDEDVLAIDVQEGGDPRVLGGGTGHQRHVVGSGAFLAWVEPDEVVLWDSSTDTRTSYPAQTGFRAPLALWQDVICWETRAGADVDIECSDGVEVGGSGDQLSPSRWDRWLLFHQDGRTWLYTAPLPAEGAP